MEMFLGIATLIAAISVILLQLWQASRISKLEAHLNRLQLQSPPPQPIELRQELRQSLELPPASQSKHVLNLLFQAREAVTTWQKNQIFLMEYMRRSEEPHSIDWVLYAQAQADLSTSWVELRTLALILNDASLSELLDEGKDSAKKSAELDFRNKAQKIQLRLGELIAEEIVKA